MAERESMQSYVYSYSELRPIHVRPKIGSELTSTTVPFAILPSALINIQYQYEAVLISILNIDSIFNMEYST